MANPKQPGLPGWMRVSLWIGGGLIAVAVVMMALGHNPLQHIVAHGGMAG